MSRGIDQGVLTEQRGGPANLKALHTICSHRSEVELEPAVGPMHREGGVVAAVVGQFDARYCRAGEPGDNAGAFGGVGRGDFFPNQGVEQGGFPGFQCSGERDL